tara:strand:- start:3979 stop:5787 length:1809 start_codon:yes stop_codon:yes gene_type:complete
MAALPFSYYGRDQQGGQQSSLIPSVQMQPTPMRYPGTTGGGGTREIDPWAGIAPFAIDYGVDPIIDFLVEKFGGDKTKYSATFDDPAPTPDYLDIEDYEDELGGFTRAQLRGEVTDPEVAEHLADQIFGPKVVPPESKLKLNVKRAANLFAGLQFKNPNEINAFIRSYGTLNTGTVPDDVRRKWVGEYLKTAAGKDLDVQTAYLDDGSGENRSAIESPRGGFYIMSKGDQILDQDVEGKVIPKGRYYENPSWIPGQGPTADVSTLRNTQKEVTTDFTEERNLRELNAANLRATIPMINSLLINKLKNPEFDTFANFPITLAGEIKEFIKVWNKDASPRYQLKETITPSGENVLTWFDPSKGTATDTFSNTGNEFLEYEVYDPQTATIETKVLDMRATFGDLANSADSRSAMIQLAYLAAAANGQTGRTLSDKDLALHLIQLGSTITGASEGIKSPQASIRALTGWLSRNLSANSIKMQELEKGSMASDYRRIMGDKTPWSDIWRGGMLNEKDLPGVQKIKPIGQVWKEENSDDYQQYLQLILEANRRYGGSALPDNPVPGVNWQDILKGEFATQESGTSNAISSVPGALVIPTRRSVRKKKL